MDFNIDAIALCIRSGDETRAIIASAIVVRGQGVKITGRGVVTTEDGLVERIANAVSIGVFQALTAAIVFRLRIYARTVFNCNVRGVVAGCCICATCAGCKVTRAIVERCRCIVVASQCNRAAAAAQILT